MLNLAALLEHSARELPEKTAIVYEGKRFSYGQINAVANKVANGLIASGIRKGDKIALICPNLPFFPMVYYAILKVGAVVVPLNILLKGRGNFVALGKVPNFTAL
jgi:long-chain acyl-CoA synthetase